MISIWLVPVVALLICYRVYQDARRQSPFMRLARLRTAKRLTKSAIFALMLALSMATTTVWLFGWEECLDGWFICPISRPAGGW